MVPRRPSNTFCVDHKATGHLSARYRIRYANWGVPSQVRCSTSVRFVLLRQSSAPLDDRLPAFGMNTHRAYVWEAITRLLEGIRPQFPWLKRCTVFEAEASVRFGARFRRALGAICVHQAKLSPSGHLGYHFKWKGTTEGLCRLWLGGIGLWQKRRVCERTTAAQCESIGGCLIGKESEGMSDSSVGFVRYFEWNQHGDANVIVCS